MNAYIFRPLKARPGVNLMHDKDVSLLSKVCSPSPVLVTSEPIEWMIFENSGILFYNLYVSVPQNLTVADSRNKSKEGRDKYEHQIQPFKITIPLKNVILYILGWKLSGGGGRFDIPPPLRTAILIRTISYALRNWISGSVPLNTITRVGIGTWRNGTEPDQKMLVVYQ